MEESLTMRILEAIQTDDQPIDKTDRILINTYEGLDEKERGIVDDIFITLTGWSLNTFINGEEY